MSFDKCLALLFSLMILGQAYLVRRYVGTWLFPACLFGLFWFGYTFFPLAVLFWVPVQPYATAFILVCTLAFSLGSVPFDWKTAFKRNAQKGEMSLLYGNSFLKRIFYLSTVSSLVFLILNSFAQGFSLHDLIFDLYASAGAYAGMRYSESLVGNIFGPLSLVSAYLAAIVGGLLFLSVPAKRERPLIIALSFLPAAFVAVTESAKGLLFLCIVLFYAGVLVNRVSTGKLHLFQKGNIKWLMLCLSILVLIVTISFLGEGLYQTGYSGVLIQELSTYFASYAFGHLYAFSDWFAFIMGGHSEFVYRRESLTHGFYTFMPLFKLMGSAKVVPIGIFGDYYYHGEVLTTNIYTMFRGLVTDFGFIGSVLFMVSTSFLFHLNFSAMLRNRRPVFATAVFIFMMAYFYYSFGDSLLMWNSIYVTFALVWTVLHINKQVTQRGGLRLTPSAVRISPATRSGLLGS